MNQKENGNIMGRQNGKTQRIEPYFKTDVSLLRKTDHEGRFAYFMQNGERARVEVLDVDLMSEILGLFEGIKAVEFMARQQDQFIISTSLAAIRQRFENGIDEMFRFIEQEIGEINVTVVSDFNLNSLLRFGQIVGAAVKTPLVSTELPISDLESDE